jgi:hypothetical protein
LVVELRQQHSAGDGERHRGDRLKATQEPLVETAEVSAVSIGAQQHSAAVGSLQVRAPPVHGGHDARPRRWRQSPPGSRSPAALSRSRPDRGGRRRRQSASVARRPPRRPCAGPGTARSGVGQSDPTRNTEQIANQDTGVEHQPHQRRRTPPADDLVNEFVFAQSRRHEDLADRATEPRQRLGPARAVLRLDRNVEPDRCAVTLDHQRLNGGEHGRRLILELAHAGMSHHTSPPNLWPHM